MCFYCEGLRAVGANRLLLLCLFIVRKCGFILLRRFFFFSYFFQGGDEVYIVYRQTSVVIGFTSEVERWSHSKSMKSIVLSGKIIRCHI